MKTIDLVNFLHFSIINSFFYQVQVKKFKTAVYQGIEEKTETEFVLQYRIKQPKDEDECLAAPAALLFSCSL